MDNKTEQAGGNRLELDVSWLRALGWSVEEVLAGGLETLIHPDDAARTIRELERIATPGAATDGFVHRLQAKDGTYRWFAWRVRSSPDGTVIQCDVEDVTDARAQQTTFAPDEPFRAMAETSPALMWVSDADGRLEYVNRSWLTFTGDALPDVIGTKWTDGVHPADVPELRLRTETGFPPAGFTCEYRRQDARGAYRWLLESGVPRLGPENHVIGWIGTCVDIDDRKVLEGQLRHEADHDALTGLVNRRRFEGELDRHVELARLHGQPGALLLVDIDNFKRVNDTGGHAEGDRLLAAVADTLRERVRASDLVARLGGDEFALVLTRVPPVRARRVAETLLDAIREREPGTTISIGVATFDRSTLIGSEELLSAADRALYDAKEAGRDRVRISGQSELEPAPLPD